MANVLVDDQYLKAIGDAIRSKKNSTDKYKPSEMADAIQSIEINVGSTSGASLDEAKIFFNVDKITVDPELHAAKVIIKINYITNDSIIPVLTNALNIDIDIVTDNTTGLYYKSGIYNFSIIISDSGSELFISGCPSVLAPDRFPNKKLIRIKDSTINNSYVIKYNINDSLITTTAIPMNFYNLSQPIQIMTNYRYTPSPEAEFKKVYIINPNTKQQYSEYSCLLTACKYSSSDGSTVMNLYLKNNKSINNFLFYDFKLLIVKTNIFINNENIMKTFVSEDDNIKLFYYNKNYSTQNLDLEDAKILFNYIVKETITIQNLENIYKKYGAIIFAANYKNQYIINKQNSFFGTTNTKDLNNIDLSNCNIINDNDPNTVNTTVLSRITTFSITKNNFLTDNITFDKVYSAITEKWLPELKENYSYYDFTNIDTYINTTLPGKTDDEKASILNTACSQLFNNSSKFENPYTFSSISDSNISNLMIYLIEKYCLYDINNINTLANDNFVVIEEEVD